MSQGVTQSSVASLEQSCDANQLLFIDSADGSKEHLAWVSDAGRPGILVRLLMVLAFYFKILSRV